MLIHYCVWYLTTCHTISDVVWCNWFISLLIDVWCVIIIYSDVLAGMCLAGETGWRWSWTSTFLRKLPLNAALWICLFVQAVLSITLLKTFAGVFIWAQACYWGIADCSASATLMSVSNHWDLQSTTMAFPGALDRQDFPKIIFLHSSSIYSPICVDMCLVQGVLRLLLSRVLLSTM